MKKKDLSILSLNGGKLDQDNDLDKVMQFSSKIAIDGYDIVLIRNIVKTQIFSALMVDFIHRGYYTLQSTEKQSKKILPGLFFASSYAIVKWEFEQFELFGDSNRIKLPTSQNIMTGLLSVLLDVNGHHLWTFSPLLDLKKVSDANQLVYLQKYFRIATKIIHSKLWTFPLASPVKNPQLTYGSYIEILYGPNGAIHDNPRGILAAGNRIRDRLQRFKILRINQTTPLTTVCYGDPVLLQTHRSMFIYATEQGIYYTAIEPKGQRSIVTFIDPRYLESTAVIRDNDQFFLKDYTGSYISVISGKVVGGNLMEEATLFSLSIFGLVPLPDEESSKYDIITIGSKVVFEEVKISNRTQYMAVEPSSASRWHVHCEALETGELETFEVVNPLNDFDVSPLWTDDGVYLKSNTGHYLTVDPRSGWVYADIKRPDSYSYFSLSKDGVKKKVVKNKKREKRESLSKPFNVQHKSRLGTNFVCKGN